MAISRILCGCVVLAASAIVGVFAASGCSSNTETDSPGLTCGVGTFEKDGQCQPLDAGTGGTAGAGGGDVDGGAGGTGGTGGGSAGGAGGTVDPSGGCPKGLKGPKLIEVSTPGGTKYCIDATEVTGEQYHEFTAAKWDGVHMDMSGQPPGCENNSAYGDLDCGSSDGDQPAFCVDWCDSWVYCAWAGKHLCGAIGGGAITSLADMNDPEKSEWYNACSSGGKHVFPYGDSYDVTACNKENNIGRPMDVPARATCHGPEAPFDDIFDMSGNVSEWVNWTREDKKGAVGGNYVFEAADSACRAVSSAPPNLDATSKTLGFRCCADDPN